MRSKLLTLGLVFIAISTSLSASTRLVYWIQNNPKTLAWSANAFPLKYEVSSEITRIGRRGAVEKGFGQWQLPESNARVQLTDATVTAGKDDRNAVTLADGLLANSGFIASTTTWFDDSGRITEADIQIDRRAVELGYNLDELVQHEAGHALGFDHSGLLSSTMYPFVPPGAPSRLDMDDRLIVASTYPAPPVAGVNTGAIRGTVRTPNGAVFGAQVVAVDRRGEPVASGLTDREGRYELLGLPAGDYQVYAEPLDGPVEAVNLSGVYREAPRTSFRTELRTVRVTGGATSDAVISLDGLPAAINPKWIGAFAPDSTEMSLGTNVAKVYPGTKVSIAVGGEGFISGMTTFELLNSGIKRVSDFRWASNFTWATFEVGGDVAPGSVVVLVRSGNESAALSGAITVAEATRRRGARR